MTISNWTGVIALIVAILSVSLPSCISTYLAWKIKKMEWKNVAEQERIHAIQAYLGATTAFLLWNLDANISNYGVAYGQVLAYLPSELQRSVMDMNKMIVSGKVQDAKEAFFPLVPKISALIQPNTHIWQ